MKTKTTIIPRYAETDKMGVIHHSVYPIWYEQGRVDFCKEIGFPFHKIEERGLMQALLSLNVEYKGATHFGDILTLITKIKSNTKLKIEFEYEIYNQDGILLNVGTTLLVWLDDNFKPINITKKHKDIYDAIANTIEKKI